uniref:30S ribosomal protein 3, chloroplastic n=1 Tax=Aegilops tauschii TaxID=37682 RepID=R7W2K6_AEGTA
MSVHPATTPALASRPRVSLPRPSTSPSSSSSSSSSSLVHIKSRRLPLRSLRILAAAAAGAVEAGEPYIGLGDEEPLGGEGDAEAVAESEEGMVFSAALNLGHFLSYKVEVPEKQDPMLVLKFIWMEKNIGIALDQMVPGVGSIPLSPYYFWPRKDAWEELRAKLEEKEWISQKQMIILLNQATDIINLWQQGGGSLST